MKTTLEYQDYGSKLIVAIVGDNQSDIEAQFNSFYNWQATENPEIFWVTENRGYFYTTAEKLLKAMTNAELFRMLNDSDEFQKHDPDGWAHCCKGIKGGFMPQARVNAQERFDAMEQNPRSRGAVNVDYYNLGTVRAENLSDKDA